MCDEIIYPFPNSNGISLAFEIWGWIDNFITQSKMDVITYPLCDSIYTMLIKWDYAGEYSKSGPWPWLTFVNTTPR